MTSRKAQIVLATLGIVVDMCRLDLIFYMVRGRLHLRTQRREWAKKQRQAQAGAPGPVHWHKMPVMPDGFRIPGMLIGLLSLDAMADMSSYEHRTFNREKRGVCGHCGMLLRSSLPITHGQLGDQLGELVYVLNIESSQAELNTS